MVLSNRNLQTSRGQIIQVLLPLVSGSFVHGVFFQNFSPRRNVELLWFPWALELALQAGEPCGRRMSLVRHGLNAVIPRGFRGKAGNLAESAKSCIATKKICEFIAIKDFGIIDGNLLNLLNIKKK